MAEDVKEPISSDLIIELGRTGLVERADKQLVEKAVRDFQAVLAAVRGKSYTRVQGIGDDFVPDTDLYNIVGVIYPLLKRDSKNKALGAVLSQLDGVNSAYVNINHTPYIREPLLLADIRAVRWPYWPGLHDEERLWKGKTSFSDLQRNIMGDDGLFDAKKVQSDFLVANALLRSDFTPFGEDYARAAHPEFLNRTLRAIATARFAGAIEAEDIERGRKRVQELFPKSTHERIEQYRQEGGWAVQRDFR